MLYKSPPVVSQGINRSLHLSLLVGLVFACVGCDSDKVRIWVDNAADKPLVVTVDGKVEATVEPGQFEIVKCLPGERQIHVQCGGKVVFYGSKTFEKPARILFNPDKRNRYVTFAVKYGSSPFEGITDRIVAAADRQKQIRYLYQKLADEFTPMPSGGWFEITDASYVLTGPPEFVTTRGFSERRKVLIRVDPKDHAALETARRKTSPSEKDLQALTEIVERVLDSAP
jgi:hypothetical protein